MSAWGTGELAWLPGASTAQPEGLSVEIGSWGGQSSVLKVCSADRVMNLYIIEPGQDEEDPWSESSTVMFLTVTDGKLLATSAPGDHWGQVVDSRGSAIDPRAVSWEHIAHFTEDVRDEHGNSTGYQWGSGTG